MVGFESLGEGEICFRFREGLSSDLCGDIFFISYLFLVG